MFNKKQRAQKYAVGGKVIHLYASLKKTPGVLSNTRRSTLRKFSAGAALKASCNNRKYSTFLIYHYQITLASCAIKRVQK